MTWLLVARLATTLKMEASCMRTRAKMTSAVASVEQSYVAGELQESNRALGSA